VFAYAPSGQLKDRAIRPAQDVTTVISNVTVIDGLGNPPSAGMTVMFRGGWIQDLVDGPAPQELAADAKTIAGDGLFLTPGLIDCHVHLTGLRGRDSFHRNIEPYPSVQLIRAARDANVVLGAGFTTVRDLGHGRPEHALALKEVIESGLIAGPRMLVSGWAISQTGGHGNIRAWPYQLVEELRPRSAFCDGPDECRAFVRRILGDGADCIKVYATEGVIASRDGQIDIPNFTLAELEAITDEAHRQGARVAAHATGLEGARQAVVAGVDTLEHGPHEPDAELLELMVERGTVLVPTLSVFEWAARDGLSDGLPEFSVERAAGWLSGRQAMVREAAAAGIPIAMGSDSGGPPRGGNNAAEIVALAKAGLAPLDAIKAATAGGACALGLDGEIGSVTAGARADFVLWRANPADDPSVMTDGENIELVIQSLPPRRSSDEPA
jgi:imidazolonepropionase-like amidohydrolase